ncbi:MAG: hypothetical protein HY423_14350, partial [Candidatus Lambdaproteobacteria bacterium]|nr:hypothetical protein [Candidatus Lambdaproteobacteria bacterium]
MTRRLVTLAVLLAASLAWAGYLARPTSAPSPGATRVRVWDVDPARVTRILYRDELYEVALEPKRQGEETAYWLRETLYPVPAPADAKPAAPAKGAPAAKPPAPRSVETFRGNARAGQALEAIARLEAVRRVGPLAGLNAGEFGFPGDTRYVRLDLTGAQTPQRLELGVTTYGNDGRYVLDAAS